MREVVIGTTAAEQEVTRPMLVHQTRGCPPSGPGPQNTKDIVGGMTADSVLEACEVEVERDAPRNAKNTCPSSNQARDGVRIESIEHRMAHCTLNTFGKFTRMQVGIHKRIKRSTACHTEPLRGGEALGSIKQSFRDGR